MLSQKAFDDIYRFLQRSSFALEDAGFHVTLSWDMDGWVDWTRAAIERHPETAMIVSGVFDPGRSDFLGREAFWIEVAGPEGAPVAATMCCSSTVSSFNSSTRTVSVNRHRRRQASWSSCNS